MAKASTLLLPPRPANAPTGSEFAAAIRDLAPRHREEQIFAEVTAGNVPNFLRALKFISITNETGGARHVLQLHVTPDYLAIGNDTNFLRIPLTPMTAQRIADITDCSLPTPKLVDAIWSAAEIKLTPAPMPPGPAMTSVPAFEQHDAIIKSQFGKSLHTPIAAGHKKDIVLAAALGTKPNSVAIYGWHKPDGKPIQPLYTGHAATWADYSHGIRLIANDALLDGKPVRLPSLFADTNLARLVSIEGPPHFTRYSTNWPTHAFKPGDALHLEFKPTGHFGETQAEFRFDPEVRVVINKLEQSAATNTLLVVYALPNGSTIEQTAGRRTQTNDNWHFNIQHIAAQTRFIRERLTNHNIVVAYLEAAGLQWPAWRKRNGDAAIPAILRSLQSPFGDAPCEVVLSGHSGGGSFIFGLISSVTHIPSDVQRIAFLDANYGFTTAHTDKLLRWLDASGNNRLLVFAYNDAAALLDGKSFVSATGGTWGRSALMLEQIGTKLEFTASTNGNLRTHQAANGRVEFLLRENPERKVWHTIQVDRNGFIHALLSGTPHAGLGYEYLGERAYEKFITSP